MKEATADILRLSNEIYSLKEAVNYKEKMIGTLEESNRNLRSNIANLETKQPLVKVVTGNVHTYHDEYDGDCSTTFNEHKVEFINLTEVERLAADKAKAEVKDQIEKLEKEIESNKYTVKSLRDSIETVQDRVNVKERQLAKTKASCKEEVEDLKDAQSKKIKELNEAYDVDVKNYKEHIKELKEEIQKVKEDKTDIEIEKKRNEEIVTLKTRISDLESILNDLNATPFYKRIFKLGKIELERNKAAQELEETRRKANNVGKTWVKEGGKYRKFDTFKDVTNSFYNIYDSMLGAIRNVYTVTSSSTRW